MGSSTAGLRRYSTLGIGPLGGLNTVDEESTLPPNRFRRLIDASLEDGKTIQFPPGDSRITKAKVAAASITLLAEYNKSDGTRKRYVKASQTLSTWDLAGTVTPTSLTSLTSGSIPGWTVMNDLFILCDPSGNYVSNGTVYGPLGADAPSAPTLAAAAGAGLNVGAYLYKISLYSSVLLEESTLSASATVTTTPGNQQVNVSGLPTLDSIWDKIRVYRTAAGGSAYFLQSERSSAANYTDTTSDATILASTPAPSTDTVRPPAAKFCVIHLNRLFLAGLTNDPDALRMSEAGFAYRFPTANRITFSVKDGDNITGMWVRDGRLYVAKEHKVFVLLGDAVSNFQLQEVETGLGVGAQRCTTTIHDREYVLDLESGPFWINSNGSGKIGQDILKTVRAFKGSRATLFVGGHEPMSRAWYISVTSSATPTANDKCFAYHYERDQWCELRLAGVSAFGQFHDSNERLRLCYGTDDGYIHMIDADGNMLRTNIGGALSGVPTAASTTTAVVTTGGLTTTSDGWAAEYLTIVFRDSNGLVTAIERKKITSNTGSTFTTSAFGTRAPTTTDLWFVGAFYLDALTFETDLGDPENRKHVPYWWPIFTPQDHSVKCYAALICDDENDSDDTDLAGFSVLNRGQQQLSVRRVGGGGRRPVKVAARFAAVGSNQPQRIRGFTVAHRQSTVA